MAAHVGEFSNTRFGEFKAATHTCLLKAADRQVDRKRPVWPLYDAHFHGNRSSTRLIL